MPQGTGTAGIAFETSKEMKQVKHVGWVCLEDRQQKEKKRQAKKFFTHSSFGKCWSCTIASEHRAGFALAKLVNPSHTQSKDTIKERNSEEILWVREKSEQRRRWKYNLGQNEIGEYAGAMRHIGTQTPRRGHIAVAGNACQGPTDAPETEYDARTTSGEGWSWKEQTREFKKKRIDQM